MNILAYITGDLNIDLFSVTNNSYNESFFFCMCSYGFLATISKATCVTLSSCTLIDNIFCNDISKIVTTGVILTDISDHFSIFAVTIIYRVNNEQSNKVITAFNYQKMDDFMQHLDSSLQHLSLESDPEQACEKIIEAYTDGIALFSKTITFSRRTCFIKPLMTPAILQSINQKNKLFAEKLKDPSACNVTKYNSFRNCLNETILNAKNSTTKRNVPGTNTIQKRLGKL